MLDFSDKVIERIERNKAATFALLQNWAGQVEGYAKRQASWTDRTGHARQSIHSEVEDHGNEMTLYLAHGTAHGSLLETGTGVYGPHAKPYIIQPKDKKALFWAGALHPVKRVNHPGIRPYPIVGPTIDTHFSRIWSTLQDLWGG